MRKLAWVATCMMLVSVVRGDVAGLTSDQTNENWIARFQQFASQKGLHPESRYGFSGGKPPAVTLSGLLRALPEPQDWQGLRQAFEKQIARSSPAQAEERSKLEAGKWMIVYLLGDRDSIETELSATSTSLAQKNEWAAHTLERLKNSLSTSSDRSPIADARKNAELFEQQIQMIEPVDEAAVERAVGGPENFKRLRRVMAGWHAMVEGRAQIYTEWEKTKDDAAAQKQVAALTQEFNAKFGDDQQALTPFTRNPHVMSYLRSEYQGKTSEADDGGSTEVGSLSVPNLIAGVGNDEARSLLRRAFRVSAKLTFMGEPSEALRRLVHEVALTEIEKIKVPSWELVNDVQSASLFEAFSKKFPKVELENYEYRSACGFYLASLIVEKRVSDAVKFAVHVQAHYNGHNEVTLPYSITEELERSRPEELWEFLHGWLSNAPAVSEWDRFTRLSVFLNKRVELGALIKKLAESEAFTGKNRLSIQQMEAGVEMATGDFGAAKRRLIELVKTPGETGEERIDQMAILIRLLELADLDQASADFKSTLAIAEANLAKGSAIDGGNAFSSSGELVAALNELGHDSDAARIGRIELDRVAEFQKKTADEHNDGDAESRLPSYVVTKLLGEQLRAYVQLGSWKEAEALLQENPAWEKSDVSGLLHEIISSKGRPVGYYAAKVVQAKGDLVLARRMVEAQLVATPGVDAVYESYVELAGQEALVLFDKLAVADHYEERPLIWKARLQLDEKKWDAAITTLQQAISIDPSDGEQGRGDRMRVYSFMSEAMAGKGDLTKASFFAGVVKAIRLSEVADRWYAIGAYGRAIDLYREALGFFQDAYCIQSRLAIRLADAGKMDEAIEHYRHAFELMPDSFGRVESHCFGCEKAFAGKKSQDVAEEVFNRMVEARPDKPQLHYLLGYLREEQENVAEAAVHYRRAVQLDPLYLNAWKRLYGLDNKLNFSRDDRDALVLKLLALDPGRKHVSPDLEKVSDLRQLWRALRDSQKILAALPSRHELYRLKATADHLAKRKDVAGYERFESAPVDFAMVLLDHSFVQALQEYLVSLNEASNETSDANGVSGE